MKVITAAVRAQGDIVLCSATTGLAALNHEGGLSSVFYHSIVFDITFFTSLKLLIIKAHQAIRIDRQLLVVIIIALYNKQ